MLENLEELEELTGGGKDLGAGPGDVQAGHVPPSRSARRREGGAHPRTGSSATAAA